MKICIVMYDKISDIQAGAGRHIFNLVNALKSTKDDVIVIHRDEKFSDKKIGKNMRLISLPIAGKGALKVLEFQFKANRFIRENIPEDYAINFSETSGFIYLFNKKHKTVTTYHHSHLEELKIFFRNAVHAPFKLILQLPYFFSHLEQRSCLRKSDYIIVDCETIKKDLVKSGIVNKKIKVINCTMKNENKIIKKDDKNLRLLFVGHLEPRKGVDILLNAMLKLRNVPLDIVGQGYMKGYYEKFIKKNKLNNCAMHGFVSEKEKEDLYKKASIFICPSRYEGFGLVILEAVNKGCAVLALDIPILRELFSEGVMLFKDADDLAEKIKYLVKNPSETEKLRKRGRKLLEKYSEERAAKEYVGFMKKIA
ncbi:MAG: glycosyltransferase family 4 protein [Candidatus Woesearchaeota archaeon]|nr:glycosyltransferase family 4 protein [Candidatus Woesearchaeota archaeon]